MSSGDFKGVLLYLLSVAAVAATVTYLILHSQYPCGNLNCLCN